MRNFLKFKTRAVILACVFVSIFDGLVNAEDELKAFPAVFYLKNLDGKNGFTIIGGGIGVGRSVSEAGDVNGDGINDILIGARIANNGAGQSYVIFGSYRNSDNTPLILGLTLGIGGAILFTGVGSYYGYRHCQHSDYTNID